MQQLELEFLYEHPVYKEYGCDEEGNVYSFRFGKLKKLKPSQHRNDYLVFPISKYGEKKQYTVHRFVYECIKGEIPEGYHIDHINFIRYDNRIDNLRVLTASENSGRQSKEGRKRNSEAVKKAKSKPVLQYDKQGNFIAEYPSVIEAARQTGVAQAGISACCLEIPYHNSAGGFKWAYKDE